MFQNAAKVGQRIRAHDFHERTDCYVEGPVKRIDLKGTEQGFAAFVIDVDKDVWRNEPITGKHSRVGRATVFVPMEVSQEWNGRVVCLP